MVSAVGGFGGPAGAAEASAVVVQDAVVGGQEAPDGGPFAPRGG